MIDVATSDVAVVARRDNDDKIEGLVVGDTTYQNQYMILKANKGEFKEHPTIGVGIDGIVNDDDVRSWRNLIVEEFKKEGLIIGKIDISNIGNLIIEAAYR